MPNIGDINTALAYNTLKGKVADVLGKGIGDKGYGQAITLTDVSNTTIISAKQWNDLRDLINSCRSHQIGSATGFSAIDLPVIAKGAIMQAVPIDKYEQAINIIYNNSLEYGDTSMSFSSLGTINRSSSWSNSIHCEFTCVWPNEDAARYFFNSGGDIRIRLSHPNGTYNNKRWYEILDKVGTIVIKARTTTAINGSIGKGNDKGYYHLTSTSTEVFSPSGGDGYGGYAYGDGSGLVVVTAVKISNGLRIRVTLNEAKSGTMSANTKAAISIQKATTYLKNPSIITPTFSVTKNF